MSNIDGGVNLKEEETSCWHTPIKPTLRENPLPTARQILLGYHTHGKHQFNAIEITFLDFWVVDPLIALKPIHRNKVTSFELINMVRTLLNTY